MKVIVFVIISFIFKWSYTQIEQITIKSFENETLCSVDSLSVIDKFMLSEYIVYCESLKPFSGVAIKTYASKGVDSLIFENGVKHGLQKSYIQNNDKGNLNLVSIEYYDQINRTRISITNNQNLRIRFGSVSFHTGKIYYSFIFRYNVDTQKVVLKKRVKQYKSPQSKIKKLSKCRFNSLDDFEAYISQYQTIFKQCQTMNFFSVAWKNM